jgi:hypothetical protein
LRHEGIRLTSVDTQRLSHDQIRVDKPPTQRRRHPAWALIGVACLVVFVGMLDVSALRAAVAMLTMRGVAVALACLGVSLLVKAWRWHRMVRSVAPMIAVPATMTTFFEGVLWGTVTFGRLGELWRVERLAAHGVLGAPAWLASILDRLMDVAALACAGVAGAIWLAGGFDEQLGLVVAGVVFASAQAVGWWLSLRALAVLQQRGQRLPLVLQRLVSGTNSGMLHPRELLYGLSLTSLSWAITVVGYAALAADMRLQIPAVTLASGMAVSSLSAILPITWQGVGAREPIFAAVLQREGVAMAAATGLSLSMFALGLLVSLVTGALGWWGGRFWRVRAADRSAADRDRPTTT